jgi:hypothetical protein
MKSKRQLSERVIYYRPDMQSSVPKRVRGKRGHTQVNRVDCFSYELNNNNNNNNNNYSKYTFPVRRLGVYRVQVWV